MNMPNIKLRLTGLQYDELRAHLFPGDGKEAVALALCGRHSDVCEHTLMVHKIDLVPHEECKERSPNRVTWPIDRLVMLLPDVVKKDLAVLKIHSHPSGLDAFSAIDDHADRDLFESVYGWTDTDSPHASAVMLPDGQMFARAVLPDGRFVPINPVAIVGDDLRFWYPPGSDDRREFTRRHAQLFGAETTARLRRLSIAVVGCSGTGTPVIEQLARLGVGRLVLIDHDHIEQKNLNRILNAGMLDAYLSTPKVEVVARSIAHMGFGTAVDAFSCNLMDARAIQAVASSDVVFGCLDSIEARHLLNRIAAFYSLPYFDLGVRLESDGVGGVDEVCGAIHYVQPDRSSLFRRGVYTMERLRAEGLRRVDPKAYDDQVKSKYIQGVAEDRPAVISVNMLIAAMAVNEFLARLHAYRYDPNGDYAIVRTSLIQGETVHEQEPAHSTDDLFISHVGRGDMKPLLDMTQFDAGEKQRGS